MHRADYVIKRIGFAVMTILVAITLNFLLFRALPGSAIADLTRVPNATPALREALTPFVSKQLATRRKSS